MFQLLKLAGILHVALHIWSVWLAFAEISRQIARSAHLRACELIFQYVTKGPTDWYNEQELEFKVFKFMEKPRSV